MPMRWLVIVIRIGIILRGGERGVAYSITRVAAGNDGGETTLRGCPPFAIVVGCGLATVDTADNATTTDGERADQ